MNLVYFLLLSACFVLIQCFIGGTRLIYSFVPFLFAGAAAALSLVSLRRPTIKPSPACVGSALLLGGYVILRALASPNPYFAREDAFLAAAALCVYLLTAIYLAQARFRTGIAFVLFAIAVAHVVVGGIQFTEGNGFMLFGFSRAAAYASRASGMFTSPNQLAGFCEAVGLMALGYTLWGRYRMTGKLIIAYIMLLCLIGLAISGSRGGYISMVVGLCFFALLSVWVVRMYNEARFSISFLGAAGGVIALVGVSVTMINYSPTLKERLLQIDQISKDARWYNWLAAVDQFKLEPVFGTGAGTHLAFARMFRRAPIQTDPQQAHSDYLEFIGEYGAVGGVLAAAFLLIHLGQGFRNIREITERRLMNTYGPPRTNSMALMLGAMGAIAAMLAHSVVDSNLHTPSHALLLAFLFGILSNAGVNQQSQSRPGAIEMYSRGVLGAIGILLLASICYRFHGERLSNQARRALEAHRYTACAQLASQAIEADPLNPENYYYHGEALRALAPSMPEPEQIRCLDQAIAAYKNGLKHFPESENLWIRLGQCLDATQRWEEAEEAYGSAIAYDPNFGVLYTYYAEHLRLAGDPDGAQKCLDAARKLAGPLRKKTDMGDPLSILSGGLKPAPAR